MNESDWGACVDTLRRACEAGAAAAYAWAGRLDKERADADASRAMRCVLADLHVGTRVVAGEGAKDEVEHLAVGEVVRGIGNSAIGLDLAVDPIEGTTNLAHGLPWALTVAAAAPFGSMFETGPSLYMDKFVVPRAAAHRVDPVADTETRLVSLAAALDKPVTALRVFVLDKPRHVELARTIARVGARVALYPAGDAVGTVAVALGDEFDAVIGIGGTPEGLLSASAVRAMGAEMFARLAPQRADEQAALRGAGLSTTRWYSASELISSERSVFCAAGISGSLLTKGITQEGLSLKVESLIISGPGGRVNRRMALHPTRSD